MAVNNEYELKKLFFVAQLNLKKSNSVDSFTTLTPLIHLSEIIIKKSTYFKTVKTF